MRLQVVPSSMCLTRISYRYGDIHEETNIARNFLARNLRAQQRESEASEIEREKLWSKRLHGFSHGADATAARHQRGEPSVDHPFEEGVSWEALEQFAKENNIDGLSVDDVCEQLIKPSTSSLRVAYSEFFKRKDARFVGRANILVSHAWLCKMTDLLSALKKWLDDRQGAERAQSWFFWIDVFVCNQESSVPKEFDWWKETFRQSVERIGRTVIVMTPWKTPTYIERAWCLFEFYITLNCKIPYDLAMSETDQVMFNAELMEGKDVVSHILKIDISLASAKFQTDKDNIMKCMEVSCQCT